MARGMCLEPASFFFPQNWSTAVEIIWSCANFFSRAPGRNYFERWELLHHGRRAGMEKTTQIRVVSGETTLILRI